MSPWRSKSLGDGVWASVPSGEIELLIQPLFESAGKPVEMAVFTRHEEGSLHCKWVAYFSPAAEEIAVAVGASPCGRPVKEGLYLLTGNEGCWAALFENP